MKNFIKNTKKFIGRNIKILFFVGVTILMIFFVVDIIS